MRWFRSIIQCIATIVSSFSFWLCVVFIIFLFMTSSLYFEMEMGQTKDCSVFHGVVIILSGVGTIPEYVNSYMALCSVNGSWMTLFAPIVVCYVFIPYLKRIGGNGYKRFYVHRMGRKAYLAEMFLSAIFTGACLMMVSYIIYSVLVVAILPGTALEGLYSDVGISSYLMEIVLMLLSLFLYGALWCAITVTLSVYIRNTYVLLSLPFLVNYGLDVLERHNPDVMQCSITSLLSLHNDKPPGMVLEIVAVYILVLMVLFIIYYLCCMRKRDFCE
ncbi:MAG: hypothetical protein J6D02_09495 [Lachnospira sp.]|nr:hypothetical protein [Lachnospira sp.]